MNIRLIFVSLLACLGLWLSGCAYNMEQLRPFESPGEALEIAGLAVSDGRWSEALATLDSAIKRFPGEARLSERRRTYGDKWAELKSLWEDQLVAARGGALLEEVKYLEPLSVAQPERLWMGVQLAQRKKSLPEIRPDLLACMARRRDSDIQLARACAELADRIFSDEQSLEAIALIEEKVDAKAEAKREKKVRRAQVNLEKQVDKAEAKLEARDFSGAYDTVDKVLAKYPNHTRAQELRERLQQSTTGQNDTMNEMASELYSDGEVDGAIRLWEASLRIDPDQPLVIEHRNRAMRVLKNLEQIKAQSPVPSGEVSGAEPSAATGEASPQ